MKNLFNRARRAARRLGLYNYSVLGRRQAEMIYNEKGQKLVRLLDDAGRPLALYRWYDRCDQLRRVLPGDFNTRRNVDEGDIRRLLQA